MGVRLRADQQRVGRLDRVAHDVVEGAPHRGGQHLLQLVVALGVAEVDDHRAAGREPVADELEELVGGEVERDVGLAVGVEEDRVVAGGRVAEERAGVLGVLAQLRALAEAEVAVADVEQLAVDLDPVDDRAREVARVGAGDGAAGEAEDRDPARRVGAGGERRDQIAVPVAAGEDAVGAVERVDRLALVELERAVAVGVVDDARVLVGRVGLVDHRAVLGRLDGADRDREQRGDAERDEPPAAREPDRGDDRQREREGQERALGAGQRDQQQRGEERAEQRADGRDRVHAAGGLARVLDALELQPDRPRGDGAEHQHRDRDEREHAEQRAEAGAEREVVERADADREERLRDDRDEREQRGGDQHEQAQRALGRGGGRPSARRTSSRPPARRARPRSCSPTRPSRRRRTAPSGARQRSRRPGSSCRRRRR